MCLPFVYFQYHAKIIQGVDCSFCENAHKRFDSRIILLYFLSLPFSHFSLNLSLVGEGWKPLSVGHCFQVNSTIQGKTLAKPFLPSLFCHICSYHTIAIIIPMLQAGTFGLVCAQAMEVGCSSWTLSARDCHWQNPRKTNYRECSNIKA